MVKKGDELHALRPRVQVPTLHVCLSFCCTPLRSYSTRFVYFQHHCNKVSTEEEVTSSPAFALLQFKEVEVTFTEL